MRSKPPVQQSLPRGPLRKELINKKLEQIKEQKEQENWREVWLKDLEVRESEKNVNKVDCVKKGGDEKEGEKKEGEKKEGDKEEGNKEEGDKEEVDKASTAGLDRDCSGSSESQGEEDVTTLSESEDSEEEGKEEESTGVKRGVEEDGLSEVEEESGKRRKSEEDSADFAEFVNYEPGIRISRHESGLLTSLFL